MTTTDDDQNLYKVSQDQPPSYNTIAPYAPPAAYPPAAPYSDVPNIKGLPVGLEYLAQINQLCLKERFTVSQGWGRSFDVLDSVGQRLFQAKQQIQCCGPIYDVKIVDNSQREIMQLLESCACTCTKQMQVYSMQHHLLGYVKLHWNSLITHLSLITPNNEVVLLVVGPSFQTNIFGNPSFEVKSSDEQHVVGMIKNENEQFFVSFPLDLEVTVKALLLGACFYMESLIYSKRKQLLNRRNSN
ncbi:phospholipid scramblase 3-like [Pelodytes ibericus]